MASPLRSVHLFLPPEHIAHLRVKAAQRHLSMSAIVREWVEKDISKERRTAAAKERNTEG